MVTCTRRIQFCAGHRVVNHENKCANVHGHNYVALITAKAPDLDGIGRVIDFSVLKEKVGGWIDTSWDHTFIASPKESSELLDQIVAMNNKPVYMLDSNPTAENMARYLVEKICPQVLEGTGVEVVKVRLWETENCYADYVKEQS
jgi:6-pyruvoyltetrahydropterin/6-carboxytetrahydropterin synthase